MANVLVLDDVLDAVNLIKRILKATGHEVVGFTEEEEALNYARTHSVDLAILDIKLKKISGLEVLEELKKIAPSMRAIILTGYPTLETAQAALTLGATEYCVKPIDNDELEEKVTRVLVDGGVQRMEERYPNSEFGMRNERRGRWLEAESSRLKE